MFRRPLIWILGAVIIGEIVAFLTGNVLYNHTSLDDAYAAGLSRVVIEGYITEVSTGGGSACVLLDSCDVYGAGSGTPAEAEIGQALTGGTPLDAKIGQATDGRTIDYSTKYSTHGISIYSDELASLGVGARVRVKGSLSEFSTPDNPGEFNKWLYYRTQGIDYQLAPDAFYDMSEPAGMSPDESSGFSISGLRASFKTWLWKIKNTISESIDTVSETAGEAGLFKAILLGDKSLIEDDTYNLFKICGIAHVLAISGLHLSIIGSAVLKLLQRIGLKRLWASVISDALLLFYVIMIDGHASAWRAFIMFTLSLLAPLIGRTYDLLSALGTAGLLMLAVQPLYALDGGFLLSFGAMAGIGILLPRFRNLASLLRRTWWRRSLSAGTVEAPSLSKTIDKKLGYEERPGRPSAYLRIPPPGVFYEKILTPLLMSLSIQLMTLPIVACLYYEITPYGILLNLLAVPVMSAVMISAILGAAFGVLSVTFGSFFIGLAHYTFKGLLAVCSLFSELPFSQVITGQPEPWQMAVYYALMAGIVTLAGNLPETLDFIITLPARLKFLFAAPEGSGQHAKLFHAAHEGSGLHAELFPAAPEGSGLHAELFPAAHEKPQTPAKGHNWETSTSTAIKNLILRAGSLTSLAVYLPILLLPLLIFRPGPDYVNLAALYVGQGDCTVITLPDNHAVLIDCGSQNNEKLSENVILPYLKSRDVDTIDMIFLSHADGDHISGLKGLLDDSSIDVMAIGVPWTAKDDTAWNEVIKTADAAKDTGLYYLNPGDSIYDGPASFHVIWPQKERIMKDENDLSMVLYMTAPYENPDTDSLFTALFTGDISAEAEKEIAAIIAASRDGSYAEADTAGLASLDRLTYLKCAHHGSRFSSCPEFLACVRPEITTISAGRRNTYGHPAPETLDRLLAFGTKIYNTKNSGAILTEISSSGTLTVTGYKDKE